MPVQSFASSDVIALRELLESVTNDKSRLMPIREHIALMAAGLFQAHACRDARVLPMLRDMWPETADFPEGAVYNRTLRPDETRRIVAQDHGYTDWADCKARGVKRVAIMFEIAVDAVVAGDIDALRGSLLLRPDLVTSCSRYGHRATLLHYATGCGVERRRQVLARNAPDVVAYLLAAGADPDATLEGSLHGATPRDLARVSATADRAGMTKDLLSALATAPGHVVAG